MRTMAQVSLEHSAAAARGAQASTQAPRWASSWRVRVVIMWLVLSAILILVEAPMIATERFGDPDDALRLIEVRDLIAGQGWFDLHQYRIAPPEGVAMHWSRLVDIPLAAMILALRPLIGTPLAELVTAVTVPLLTLLAALMLVGRLAAKFFDAEQVGIACLVTGIAGPLLFQITPLRIDHHGWQVVLALVALNGLAARNPVRGGLVIGTALAALLAISIEGLPITAVFLGVLGWRALLGRSEGRTAWYGFGAAATALALASITIFATTRGFGDLATHCDQVSPIHLALFGVVALGSLAITAAAPRRWPIALAALGATAAATLALYLRVAPQCRGGAFVALDPLVMRFWYEGVNEGRPFWHLPLPIAIETAGVPLIGLGCAIALWRSTTDALQRAWWRDHAMVIAGAALIGASLARASATACAFAALPTAVIVLRAIVALRSASPLRRIVGYPLIMVMLMPPVPVIAWQRLAAAPANRAAGPTQQVTQCNYPIAARGLDRLPATNLFLPLDMGPDFLLRTHHRVVATGHHRGAAGMRDVITAFLGTPDEAHAIITRRRATVIAVCPDIAEPNNYRYYAPNGFMAQLLRGQTPRWLEPVDLAPGSHLKFWRVKG